jgi:uncharacterized protein
MALIYLDTSVVVKRYRREPGTDFMDALLQNPSRSNTFYTSFLSVLELTATIMRLIGGTQLTEETGQEILRQFRRDLREGYVLLPLDNDTIGKAISVVQDHKLRSADAIHLATAIDIFATDSTSQHVFITSDHELLSAAQIQGMTTIDPNVIARESVPAEVQRLESKPES